jgi:hypothetical protein
MDARNLLDPVAAAGEGFSYAGIGIPATGERFAQVAV